MESQHYVIIHKEYLNYNTFIMKVSTATKHQSTTTSCYARIKGNESFKPYSPIKVEDYSLTFIIKNYEQGNVSKFISEKNVNDTLEIQFPFSKGEFKDISDVLMIAGGTGITPMLQILYNSKMGKNNFTLLFYNKSDEDIFYAKELDELANVFYFVEKGSHLIGKPSLQNIKEVTNNKMYKYVYVCGPPGMMECVCGKKNPDKSQGELKGILKELGYNENNVHKF